jgi:hypothetical protein
METPFTLPAGHPKRSQLQGAGTSWPEQSQDFSPKVSLLSTRQIWQSTQVAWLPNRSRKTSVKSG